MSILLYNSDKKELIGVFNTIVLAARYLYPFGTGTQRAGLNIKSALREKSGIKNTDLGCRIVVRQNTDKDHLINPELGYYIAEGYRRFVGLSDKGFTDTKQTFQAKSNVNIGRYWAEQKTKKQP